MHGPTAADMSPHHVGACQVADVAQIGNVSNDHCSLVLGGTVMQLLDLTEEMWTRLLQTTISTTSNVGTRACRNLSSTPAVPAVIVRNGPLSLQRLPGCPVVPDCTLASSPQCSVRDWHRLMCLVVAVLAQRKHKLQDQKRECQNWLRTVPSRQTIALLLGHRRGWPCSRWCVFSGSVVGCL